MKHGEKQKMMVRVLALVMVALLVLPMVATLAVR